MYEIIPYVGVGEIRYGMKCDEVCGLLCGDYRRIDNVYTAGYKLCTRNLNIHFDENDMFIAMEGNIDAGFCYRGFMQIEIRNYRLSLNANYYKD